MGLVWRPKISKRTRLTPPILRETSPSCCSFATFLSFVDVRYELCDVDKCKGYARHIRIEKMHLK